MEVFFMKKLLIITLVIVTLLSNVVCAQEIRYNEKVLKPGVNELVIFDSVIYVNPNYIFKELGYEVSWDIQYNSLMLYGNRNALYIDMYKGRERTAKYSSVTDYLEMDNQPLVINNQPMIPLVECLELLDYGVVYNNDKILIVDKFDYNQLKVYKNKVLAYINDTYGDTVKEIHDDGDFGATGTIYFSLADELYCHATIDLESNLVEDSFILRNLEKKYKEKYELKGYYGYGEKDEGIVSYKNLYITGTEPYKAYIDVWCVGDADEYLDKKERELYSLAKGLYRDGIETEIICRSIEDYPNFYDLYYNLSNDNSVKKYELIYEKDMSVDDFYASAKLLKSE